MTGITEDEKTGVALAYSNTLVEARLAATADYAGDYTRWRSDLVDAVHAVLRDWYRQSWAGSHDHIIRALTLVLSAPLDEWLSTRLAERLRTIPDTIPPDTARPDEEAAPAAYALKLDELRNYATHSSSIAGEVLWPEDAQELHERLTLDPLEALARHLAAMAAFADIQMETENGGADQ